MLNHRTAASIKVPTRLLTGNTHKTSNLTVSLIAPSLISILSPTDQSLTIRSDHDQYWELYSSRWAKRKMMEWALVIMPRSCKGSVQACTIVSIHSFNTKLSGPRLKQTRVATVAINSLIWVYIEPKSRSTLQQILACLHFTTVNTVAFTSSTHPIVQTQQSLS